MNHRTQCDTCCLGPANICFSGNCCIGLTPIPLTIDNSLPGYMATFAIPCCSTISITLQKSGGAWTITWSCGGGPASSYTFTPAETSETPFNLLLRTTLAVDNGSCCNPGTQLTITVTPGAPCPECFDPVVGPYINCMGAFPTSFQVDVSGIVNCAGSPPLTCVPGHSPSGLLGTFQGCSLNGTFILNGPGFIGQFVDACGWIGPILPGGCQPILLIYPPSPYHPPAFLASNPTVFFTWINCAFVCLGFGTFFNPCKPLCPSFNMLALPFYYPDSCATQPSACCCDGSGATVTVTALP